MHKHRHKNSSRITHIALVSGLFVLALVLRLWRIGVADLGNDECFSAYHAQGSIGFIASTLLQGDNPPLWELLLHGWIWIAGISPVALRSLSALLSALTVVPLYAAGRRIDSTAGAIGVSLLFALSPLSLFLAHEARVYSLLGLLSATSMLLFLRLAEEKHCKHRKLYLVGLGTSNLLLLYGHYLAAWVPLMQAALWLVVPRLRRALGRPFAVMLAAVALLFAPLLPFVWQRLLTSGLAGTWIPRSQSVMELPQMLNFFWGRSYITLLVLLAGAAAAALWAWRWLVRRDSNAQTALNHYAAWLTAMCAVPLVVSFTLSYRTGFFLNRYFYFVAPPLLLSAICYLRMLPARWLSMAMGCGLIALMAINFEPDSCQLPYAARSTKTEQAVQQAMELSRSTGYPVVVQPRWLNLRIIYYVDADHSLFRSLGSTDSPGRYRDSQMLQHFRTPGEQRMRPAYPFIELREQGNDFRIRVFE